MTKYYADIDGNYLGGFDGAEPPVNSIEVPAPNHGLDTWNGTSWDAYTPPVEPDPDAELQADIEAATNFATLKAALLGQGPNQAKVKGRK